MEELKPSIALGAMVGLSTGYCMFKHLYQNMTPSVHADESGAIGVVFIPIFVAGATCMGTVFVVETIVEITSRLYRKYSNN